MDLDPRKCVLCWPNHLNESSVSGGGWEPALPLAQILDRTPSEIARSLDLAPSNTQMIITLNRFRPIGLVAFYAHNLTASAMWRVTVYFDAERREAAWQGEWHRVWPAVYSTAELEWEYDNFWGGELDEDDQRDFTPRAWLYLPSVQIARAVHIELSDPGNQAGHVAIGRVFISDVWQPEYNMSYGVQWGHDDGTEAEEADDEARTEYFDIKTPKRTVSFSLDHLGREEGFRRMLAMQRRLGTHSEVMFAESIIDIPESFATTIIGRLVQLNPLTHPNPAQYTSAVAIQEFI